MDFRTYRPAMLERRIANHLAAAGTTTILSGIPAASARFAKDEAFRLLERITIKVSRFLSARAGIPSAARVCSPGALAAPVGGQPLRIACVGCGAGEEPYTFAMLLEQAGIEASFRPPTSTRPRSMQR